MPKRSKFSWKDKNMKKVKTETSTDYVMTRAPFVYSNENFDNYYQSVFDYYGSGKEEIGRFKEIMASKLPIVFRVNRRLNCHEVFVKKLRKWQQELGFEFFLHETLAPLIVGQIQLNRQELKKSERLSEFHSFVSKAAESGLITRQELVSMLPPIALDIQPNEVVLDMCAAPGSKTSQMIESLHGSNGVVVGNDSDYKRANMMIHQIQRLNSPNFLILCSDAQFLPFEQMSFDKVLVDVPCSGDGALRKLPEKWANWSTRDGECLHPLQCHLLFKGLQLLKVGGTLVYSTCSINPIEDEAVVASTLKKFPNGELEIVDVHEVIKGFKMRKGMRTWLVEEIHNKGEKRIWTRDDLQEKEAGKSLIRESMFPPNESESWISDILERTARVMPHDQDSGGFYLAIFKRKLPHSSFKEQSKVHSIEKKIEEFEEQKINEINEVKAQKKEKRLSENFIPPNAELWNTIQSKFNLSPQIQSTDFIVQKLGEKRMNLLSLEGHKILSICKERVKAFAKEKDTVRLCHDSVEHLFPFLSTRTHKISKADFIQLATGQSNKKYEELPEDVLEWAKSQESGSIVLYYEENGNKEYLVCSNFGASLVMMAPKEWIDSFTIRMLE